ncbi:MAG: hypothetical protein K9M54_03440 [Kiritimatiellales bacterium]|nr:hypothetical protein [Kiritimatiellales bacterium]
MIKGITKLLETGGKLGKRYALKAAGEAIENVVPGGDLGMDIGKAVLSKWIDGDATEAVAAGIKDLSDEDYNKLAELLVDVLALAEVAAQARMDGEITPEETDAVFDSIDELRQNAEAVLAAF